MKFTTLGFLTFVLWTTFVLSLISIPLGAWRAQDDEIAEHIARAVGGMRYDAEHREVFYLKKLARHVSPPSNVYMLVLSAGFLAVMRTQRLVGTILVDAIHSSPDTTAEALRRSVKPKGH
jgi:hypothetical protein